REFVPSEAAIVVQVAAVERCTGPSPFVRLDEPVTIDVRAGEQLLRHAIEFPARQEIIALPIGPTEQLAIEAPLLPRDSPVVVAIERREPGRGPIVESVLRRVVREVV